MEPDGLDASLASYCKPGEWERGVWLVRYRMVGCCWYMEWANVSSLDWVGNETPGLLA